MPDMADRLSAAPRAPRAAQAYPTQTYPAQTCPAQTNAGMLNVTQHWFDHDMDQWGKTRGDEVHEQGHRFSRLLGPDGLPLAYPKARIGFDLTPRSGR